MCILQSHKNVNIWGLPLRLDIVHYLFPMWHVCSNKFHFSFVVVFWLLFGWVCLVWFFSNMHSIYFVRNHLFHFILIMALPVGLNNWNYEQTLVKCGGLFLISCHMLIGCEDWSWSSFLYTTEKYLHILLVMTSDSNNCGGFCPRYYPAALGGS